MNIKQKVEELYNKRFDYSFCCGGDYCDGDHNGGVKKDILEFANDLDLLYRKEMEREIKNRILKYTGYEGDSYYFKDTDSKRDVWNYALETIIDLVSHKKTK